MNGRAALFQIQGISVLIIIVGYVALTFYSLIRWNAEISAALVTGFVLFAQTIVRGFFEWLNTVKPTNGKPEEPAKP
mgnify:CR=1 FL=1